MRPISALRIIYDLKKKRIDIVKYKKENRRLSCTFFKCSAQMLISKNKEEEEIIIVININPGHANDILVVKINLHSIYN
jgi:hypothetical protein